MLQNIEGVLIFAIILTDGMEPIVLCFSIKHAYVQLFGLFQSFYHALVGLHYISKRVW